MIPNGKYIKRRFNLCHKPSFATSVFENSSLSDITNNVKNSNARTKHAMLIPPVSPSWLLYEIMAINKGTNRNSIKPMIEPAPWILEANVTTSLDSFTLKKQVKMHAPTANTAMKMTDVTVRPFDTDTYIL